MRVVTKETEDETHLEAMKFEVSSIVLISAYCSIRNTSDPTPHTEQQTRTALLQSEETQVVTSCQRETHDFKGGQCGSTDERRTHRD